MTIEAPTAIDHFSELVSMEYSHDVSAPVVSNADSLNAVFGDLTLKERQALAAYLGLDKGRTVEDTINVQGFDRNKAIKFTAAALRRLESQTQVRRLARDYGQPHINDGVTTTRLYESNQKLVPFVFKLFFSKWICTPRSDDFIEEGQAGLLRASVRFDTGLGFAFSSYACIGIRMAMTRCERTIAKTHNALSLQAPLTKSGLALQDFVPDPTNLSNTVANKLVAEELLELLTTDERRVVDMRHGLGDHGIAHNTQEVAHKLKIPSPRVRQLYATALEKMRDKAKSAQNASALTI